MYCLRDWLLSEWRQLHGLLDHQLRGLLSRRCLRHVQRHLLLERHNQNLRRLHEGLPCVLDLDRLLRLPPWLQDQRKQRMRRLPNRLLDLR
jgi:hypothetical protein